MHGKTYASLNWPRSIPPERNEMNHMRKKATEGRQTPFGSDASCLSQSVTDSRVTSKCEDLSHGNGSLCNPYL
jgi:hypothetical protein